MNGHLCLQQGAFSFFILGQLNHGTFEKNNQANKNVPLKLAWHLNHLIAGVEDVLSFPFFPYGPLSIRVDFLQIFGRKDVGIFKVTWWIHGVWLWFNCAIDATFQLTAKRTRLRVSAQVEEEVDLEVPTFSWTFWHSHEKSVTFLFHQHL